MLDVAIQRRRALRAGSLRPHVPPAHERHWRDDLPATPPARARGARAGRPPRDVPATTTRTSARRWRAAASTWRWVTSPRSPDSSGRYCCRSGMSCVMRAGHPLASRAPTRAALARLRYALVRSHAGNGTRPQGAGALRQHPPFDAALPRAAANPRRNGSRRRDAGASCRCVPRDGRLCGLAPARRPARVRRQRPLVLALTRASPARAGCASSSSSCSAKSSGYFARARSAAIQSVICASRTSSGTAPSSMTALWKRRRSNRSPSSARALARSALIFSSPIL